MKLLNLRSPIYNKHGSIDCEILIEGFKDYIPFTASADDIEEHGRKIHELILSCKYGEIEPYIEPEKQEDN